MKPVAATQTLEGFEEGDFHVVVREWIRDGVGLNIGFKDGKVQVHVQGPGVLLRVLLG